MTIHAKTQIGAVSLIVRDFKRSLPYYQQGLGFQLHRQEGDVAYLGAGGRDLLILTERPSAPIVQRTTGLYHFAILLPSRLALAYVLKHLIENEVPISGASDHLVSEALYLSDPDGNGIEIYSDRPRSDWPYANGQLQMDTLPFDAAGVLAELKQHPPTVWQGLEPGTIIGHIHLHVAYLAAAETFYTQKLGLELILHYGQSAAFVAAGGYHHHIGMNSWAGVGAPPPPEGAVGLQWYELLLPDEAAFQTTAVALQQADVPFERSEAGIFLRDPSQNGIWLRAATAV